MASRPKRNCTSIHEQEELLQQFYEDFDKDEVFLDCKFIDNDNGDNDFMFSSAGDDSDNGEISNVTVVDALEPEDEEEMEEHDKLLEHPIELSRKEKFKNLDAILNEDNYAALPPQGNCKFLYSKAKKTVNITWNTISDQNIL